MSEHLKLNICDALVKKIQKTEILLFKNVNEELT